MQELHFYEYSPERHHADLLRRSEYARLAEALRAERATGKRIYQLAGQRLIALGEALQRGVTQREPVIVGDRRVRTTEMPVV